MSTQKEIAADALAKAVRAFIPLMPDGMVVAEQNEMDMARALAAYEAAAQPEAMPILSPIEELDRADFSAWRHWFEENGEPAGLSTAMIWDKALRYAIAKYAKEAPKSSEITDSQRLDWLAKSYGEAGNETKSFYNQTVVFDKAFEREKKKGLGNTEAMRLAIDAALNQHNEK